MAEIVPKPLAAVKHTLFFVCLFFPLVFVCNVAQWCKKMVSLLCLGRRTGCGSAEQMGACLGPAGAAWTLVLVSWGLPAGLCPLRKRLSGYTSDSPSRVRAASLGASLPSGCWVVAIIRMVIVHVVRSLCCVWFICSPHSSFVGDRSTSF